MIIIVNMLLFNSTTHDVANSPWSAIHRQHQAWLPASQTCQAERYFSYLTSSTTGKYVGYCIVSLALVYFCA